MFALQLAALALALALSPVAPLVVPRANPPTDWNAALENYDTYHTRYMDLGCQSKHNTPFFDTCCHPLLATQSLQDGPAECDPYDDCDDGHDTTPTPSPSPSPAPAKPTTTSKPAPAPSPSAKPSPSPSPTPKSSPDTSPNVNDAAVNDGGFATYFYQNGVAGACGTVHGDNELVAAMDYRRYGNLSVKSGLCGKKVRITNPANGQSVVVIVADACPTCNNANSIDLSLGAFKAIAPLSQGLVKIKWSFA